MSYSLFSTEQIDFHNEPLFFGSGRNVARLDLPVEQWIQKQTDKALGRTWFKHDFSYLQDAKDFDTLSLELKELFLANLKFQTVLDSVATRTVFEVFKPITTNPQLEEWWTVHGFQEGIHCFIDGTEVLTDRGFIDFADLTYDDKVANWHQNLDIIFSSPLDIIDSDYDGYIYDFSGQAFHQAVTPNHRMVMQYPEYVDNNSGNSVRIKLAENTSLNNWNLPIAGNGTGEISILSDIDRLAIAYQADGSSVNKYHYNGDEHHLTHRGYCYKFSFKKERKKNRLRNLLETASLEYTETVSSTRQGYSTFYIWTKTKFDKSFSWIDISMISSSYGCEFIDELRHWDGHTRKNGSIVYGNTNNEAIEKVIAIATISGYQSGIDLVKIIDGKGFNKHGKPRVMGKNKKDYTYIHLVKNKYHKAGRAVSKTKHKYSGKIRCCTVDSGMIIIRSNGHISVSGNSASYAELIKALPLNATKVFDDIMINPDILSRAKDIVDCFDHTVMQNAIMLTDSVTDDALRYDRDKHKTSLVLSLFALNILEAGLFQTSFITTFAFAENGLMESSGKSMSKIAQDEINHKAMTQHLINRMKTDPEWKYIFEENHTEIMKMYKSAYEADFLWIDYIFRDGARLLGLNADILKQYAQWNIYRAMHAIGLEPFVDKIAYNPCQWSEKYTKTSNLQVALNESDGINYFLGKLNKDINEEDWKEMKL